MYDSLTFKPDCCFQRENGVVVCCRSSAEESDIEGMEVIGEDGESLEDEDEEEDDCPAERTDLAKEGKKNKS